ncbi:MAG: hypothetical protein M3331_06980, partial [Actinomycetota bacterium]|nr:hypothetical protein [Actinomycetota bacterium]
MPDLSKAAYPGLNLSLKPELQDEPAWPVKSAVARAEEIARNRQGLVSFAAVGPGGRTVGFEPNRQYFSASVTKCMLLVAELRRLRREG